MKNKMVISLCDISGVMVQPWLDAGYYSLQIDLGHPAGWTHEGRRQTIGCDIRTLVERFRFLEWLKRGDIDIAAIFAFPPCTHLAVSGARWWKEKGLSKLAEAIQIVAACLEICEWGGAPYMLENPIGALSTHWRKADFHFDPCDFAGYLSDPSCDAYTKRTCLWVGNGFKIPSPRPVVPVLGSKMHMLPPSDDRAALRSLTPAGFARAVFEANVSGVAA